jgi:cytochrome c oxidase subunit 2
MVIPGHISEITVDFDDPGEYTMLCHEYCGIGHHNMSARIIVE